MPPLKRKSPKRRGNDRGVEVGSGSDRGVKREGDRGVTRGNDREVGIGSEGELRERGGTARGNEGRAQGSGEVVQGTGGEVQRIEGEREGVGLGRGNEIGKEVDRGTIEEDRGIDGRGQEGVGRGLGMET